MLSLHDAVRVFVSREPVDFRKAHDGLAQIVRDHFGDDPLSGHLFVFTNKRRDQLKILFFDRNGLWLLHKRLEQGTFPRFALGGVDARCEVDRSWLSMLLDGLEPFSARVHSHHVSRVRIQERKNDERSAPRRSSRWSPHRLKASLTTCPMAAGPAKPVTGGRRVRNTRREEATPRSRRR